MTGVPAGHRAHRGIVVENVSAACLHDLVHQIDQVGSLISSLILLGEILDSIVDEVFESQLGFGRALLEVVKEFEEFPCVLLAVRVAIWLIEELQGLDKDIQAFLLC